MTFEEFLRIYPLRAPNLMWLLGAGASAASNMPTATDLIWEFKRTLYCSAQRISIRSCSDLSNTILRERLNAHFQTVGGFPDPGAPQEYATYFEAAYPNPTDRRTLLDRFLTGAKPSYGHLVLSLLVKAGQARLLWTTNFDRLLEDAATAVGVPASELLVAALDNAGLAMDTLNAGRWPLVAKLHGDFQSSRLKNTSDELRHQDAVLRRALIESIRRFGLIVVGYSGRDDSIMDALQAGIAGGQGYPHGIFWFERPEQPILPKVAEFLEQAIAAGISAHLLHAQTFDELLGDLVKQIPELPTDIVKTLDLHGPRITDVAVAPPGTGWPVVRTNALPLQSWPRLCRFVECQVPGFRALRQALTSCSQTVATLTKRGVLAFGSDQELRQALRQYDVRSLDSHTIDHTRLHAESFELGLLRDALGIALARIAPVVVQRKRTALILQPNAAAAGPRLQPLRQCTGQIEGTIPRTQVQWSEAMKTRLEYRLDRLWLVLEPTIYLSSSDSENPMDTGAADFVRERLAVRYNRQWNAVLEAWITLLFGDEQDLSVAAFGSDAGIDAAFTISRITGFSRRGPQ